MRYFGRAGTAREKTASLPFAVAALTTVARATSGIAAGAASTDSRMGIPVSEMCAVVEIGAK